MATPTTTATAPTRRRRMDGCPDPTHRRRALARARRCTTCRKEPGYAEYGSPAYRDMACLGCGRVIHYYSCAPGSCVACAHDPCWVPVW